MYLQSPQFPSFDCHVPQPTCYWKWHSWQLGNLTTSSVSVIIFFSCRGSYLGSPLPMPLLIGPVPPTFEVFFFLWPFCLWCWSFHNVGRLSDLLQSPTGHLKCHQVLNVSPLPLQEFAMVKENTDDSLGFSSSGNGATNWYFSQINTERTLLRNAHL